MGASLLVVLLGLSAAGPAAGPQIEPPVIEVQARALERAGLFGDTLAVPVELLCCDCCAQSSCIGMQTIDRSCFGGRMSRAWTIIAGYVGLGLIIGVVAGCGLGFIPALLIAGLSLNASQGNNASADDAVQYAFMSFLLSEALFGALGGLVGVGAGVLVGAVHGSIVVFTGEDPALQPREERRPRPKNKRPARRDDRRDEPPPSEPAPNELPPEDEDAYDPSEGGPPGDAPPPPSMTF